MNTTNNVAEPEAAHDALKRTFQNSDTLTFDGRYIRLYTDSQYTRDVLLAPSIPKLHAYLVESIKALGAKLRYDHALPVTIRWIPSHIELTAWGRRPITETAEQISWWRLRGNVAPVRRHTARHLNSARSYIQLYRDRSQRQKNCSSFKTRTLMARPTTTSNSMPLRRTPVAPMTPSCLCVLDVFVRFKIFYASVTVLANYFSGSYVT